jgi:hypothetical protein
MSGLNGEINWDNPNEKDFQAMMDSVEDDGIIESPYPTTRPSVKVEAFFGHMVNTLTILEISL